MNLHFFNCVCGYNALLIMANIIAELQQQQQNGYLRQRKGSIRDTECRQEEEGGQENDGVLKMLEPSPKVKFLKRCYDISALILKLVLALVIFVVLMNMMSSLAFQTVTSKRLNLFGQYNDTNSSSTNITQSLNNTNTTTNTTDL